MPKESLLRKSECNINISHEHSGLLYMDLDQDSKSYVPMKNLSTLINRTPNYVLQERNKSFPFHDPRFYCCLKDFPPCPNGKILSASKEFQKSLPKKETECSSLIHGGTISPGSNFSMMMYDDMEFFDYTSKESTQLYYTKHVSKDGMLMKELQMIALSMHVQPEWLKDELLDCEFLGFVSMNNTSGKRGSFMIGSFVIYTVEDKVIKIIDGISRSVFVGTNIIERLLLICQSMNVKDVFDPPKALQFSICSMDKKSINGWMCQPSAKISSSNDQSIITISSYIATWPQTYYHVSLKYASTQSLFGLG